MESAVFGPLMGYGCPDRASLLIGQWATTDPNFKKWAEYMDVEDEVSPAWAYAEAVILTPLADWAGKVWKFWTLPGSPPPGTPDGKYSTVEDEARLDNYEADTDDRLRVSRAN